MRFVPKGRIVVLGLASTKVARVETADQLKRRIDAASRYMSVEQPAISPQCGFASDIGGNPRSEDDQWAKLEVARNVAAEAWG